MWGEDVELIFDGWVGWSGVRLGGRRVWEEGEGEWGGIYEKGGGEIGEGLGY